MKYELPKLPYAYDALIPYISAELLTIHHTKHHQAYVNNANAMLDKLDKARIEKSEIDIKSSLKDLSFNIGGHILHSLFWSNMSPKGKNTVEPKGALMTAIRENFTSYDRFKEEFSKAASTVEGSGWALLCLEPKSKKLIIMQVEKHNVNIAPGLKILLTLDVWEHAYYLDYKNDRAKFIESFWNIINWNEVAIRLKK